MKSRPCARSCPRIDRGGSSSQNHPSPAIAPNSRSRSERGPQPPRSRTPARARRASTGNPRTISPKPLRILQTGNDAGDPILLLPLLLHAQIPGDGAEPGGRQLFQQVGQRGIDPDGPTVILLPPLLADPPGEIGGELKRDVARSLHQEKRLPLFRARPSRMQGHPVPPVRIVRLGGSTPPAVSHPDPPGKRPESLSRGIQGFPVFHGCGPMSKVKPRSALALRALKPSTTNR
jgi:hypothetical protein